MTSVILHLVIAFVVGLYLVSQTQRFQELLSAEILKPVTPPKPQFRKPAVKPIVKRLVPTQNPVVVEQVRIQSRAATSFSRRSTFQSQTVVGFTHKAFTFKTPIHPDIPKVATAKVPVLHRVTHADFMLSDAPGALAFSAPVVSALGVRLPNIGRGVAGNSVHFLSTWNSCVFVER